MVRFFFCWVYMWQESAVDWTGSLYPRWLYGGPKGQCKEKEIWQGQVRLDQLDFAFVKCLVPLMWKRFFFHYPPEKTLHVYTVLYKHWVQAHKMKQKNKLLHTGYAAIENALKIDERGSKIARNSVFDCYLSPVGRQMTIVNSVPNDFWSTFVDSISVFDCRLPGVYLFTLNSSKKKFDAIVSFEHLLSNCIRL